MKTLKDIEIDILNNTKLCNQNWIQQTETIMDYLRQSAIEWIKAIIIQPYRSDGIFEREFLIAWIKHFFNITEKD